MFYNTFISNSLAQKNIQVNVNVTETLIKTAFKKTANRLSVINRHPRGFQSLDISTNFEIQFAIMQYVRTFRVLNRVRLGFIKNISFIRTVDVSLRDRALS